MYVEFDEDIKTARFGKIIAGTEFKMEKYDELVFVKLWFPIAPDLKYAGSDPDYEDYTTEPHNAVALSSTGPHNGILWTIESNQEVFIVEVICKTRLIRRQ